MRLTLRTLLAYIDDTLDADQTKHIGTKVAESDVAQQIIERIKKLMRKRSLSTPAITGGEGVADDPNAVAEYLDNELTTEMLNEIEDLCLNPDQHVNSDVALAELAACHQILTLVLGEPARVPPSARQRMYRLVKGRESIPYRKPAANTALTSIDPDEQVAEVYASDEAYLLGMPVFRRQSSWQRRLAPIGALLVLLGLLTLSISMVLPGESKKGIIYFERPNIAQAPVVTPTKSEEKLPLPKVETKVETKIDPMVEPKIEPKVEPKVEPKIEPKIEPKVDPPKQPLIPPVDKPDPKREIVGQFVSENMVLLSRQTSEEPWKRVVLTSPAVSSATELVCLPGYRSEIVLNTGVRLMLWGNLPEFLEMPILETRLKLHTPAPGIDADFTLEAGRIFLSTKKADKPSNVRVRFRKEVWDITLPNDQSEVILDLFSRYPPGVPFSPAPGGEGPQSEFYAGVTKGSAGFRIGMSEFAVVPAPSVLIWDNKGNGKVEPIKLEAIPPQWSKAVSNDPQLKQYIQDLEAALLEFSKLLSKKEVIVEVMLAEAVTGPREKWSNRVLAVFCMEAVDALTSLADALNDQDHPEARTAAVLALRHWIGGAPERDLQFHQVLVAKKGFNEKQATNVLTLLHSFSREQISEPATYEALIALLDHDKVAVRELAWWHLSRLDAEGARDKKLMYSAAFPDDVRTRVVAEWKKRIPDGKLPPRAVPPKN